MKIKKSKVFIYLFCIITLMIGNSAIVFGANNVSVAYNGENQILVFQEGNDLFLNFKEILPGDRKEQNISIINNSNESFRLRLSAELMENKELLDQLTITVSSRRSGTNTITQLYSGPASAWKDNPDGSYIDLGAYNPNYEGILNVVVEVPENLSNQYAGKEAKIKWIFSLEKAKVEGALEVGNTGKVDTGDYSPIIQLIAVLASTGVIITVFARQIKKKITS